MLQYHQNFPQYINHGFTQACTCSILYNHSQTNMQFRLQNSAASQDDAESSTTLPETSWLWFHAILNVNRECVHGCQSDSRMPLSHCHFASLYD